MLGDRYDLALSITSSATRDAYVQGRAFRLMSAGVAARPLVHRGDSRIASPPGD